MAAGGMKIRAESILAVKQLLSAGLWKATGLAMIVGLAQSGSYEPD